MIKNENYTIITNIIGIGFDRAHNNTFINTTITADPDILRWIGEFPSEGEGPDPSYDNSMTNTLFNSSYGSIRFSQTPPCRPSPIQ